MAYGNRQKRDVCHVVVDSCDQIDNYEGQGQKGPYTLYQWECSGSVDGKARDFTISIRDNPDFELTPGWEGDCEDFTSNPKYPKFSIPKGGERGGKQQRSAPAGKPQAGHQGGHDLGMTVGNALNVSAVFHAHRDKSTIEEVLRDALKVFSWSRDIQAGKTASSTRPQPPPARPQRELPPDNEPPPSGDDDDALPF